MTLGVILGIPKNVSVVAEVYRQRWLEESERWPENVDLTYLVRGTGLWQASITKILT